MEQSVSPFTPFPTISTDNPEPQFYTHSLFKSLKFCTLHLSVLELSYPFSFIFLTSDTVEAHCSQHYCLHWISPKVWDTACRSGGDTGDTEELRKGDRKGREGSAEWAVVLVQWTVGHSLTGRLRSHGECLVKLSLQRMGHGNIYLQVPMHGWLRIAFWFLGAVFPSMLRLQRKPEARNPRDSPRDSEIRHRKCAKSCPPQLSWDKSDHRDMTGGCKWRLP